MSQAWWALAPRNRNVRILAVCSKTWDLIHTSLQYMMAMALQGEKLVRQPTTISPQSSRNILTKESFLSWNLTEMWRAIYPKYSKMLRRSWNQAALITQVQVPVPFQCFFKEIRLLSPTLEILGLSSTELLIRKSWLSSSLMITNQFDLTKERGFKGKVARYIAWLMKVSKLDLLEFGLMRKGQESPLPDHSETLRPRGSGWYLSHKSKTLSWKILTDSLWLDQTAAGTSCLQLKFVDSSINTKTGRQLQAH